MKNLLIALSILTLTSCNSGETASREIHDSTNNNIAIPDSSNFNQSNATNLGLQIILVDTSIVFQDKVFDLGENNLLNGCHFDYACDCCYGNIIFNSDSTYYETRYCMSDKSITKGKYYIENNYLILQSDKVKVYRSYNWENESDTTAIDYILSDSIIKPYSITFTAHRCENKVRLIDINDPNYSALSSDRIIKDELNLMEAEGIINQFKKTH